MMMWPLLLVTILHTALGGMIPPGVATTPTEQYLNDLCARSCLQMEQCFLRDDTECGNYIHCEKMPKTGSYRGLIRACAFGTYWGGLAVQKKRICDVREKVVCNIDRCANLPPGQNRYAYEWNCMGYWECTPKGPQAKCCSKGSSFDRTSLTCVNGLPCDQGCPIKTDECSKKGTLTAPYGDGSSCRTYWDCVDNTRPHPVCCPPGEGYDIAAKGCVPDATCTEECPPGYEKDICQEQSSYKLHGKECHTFMKCNAITGDERWCCKLGDYYDPATNTCIEKPATMTCEDVCPSGYNFVCHLEQVPTNRSQYIQYVHGNPMTMTCASGSEFNYTKCGCGDIVRGTIDNSCNMELDVLFTKPNMLRSGSQRTTMLVETGTIKEGKALNNRISAYFDGQSLYRANFFHQSMPNLFLHVIFLPGNTGAGEKQDIISNCGMLDGGGPSLELYIQNNELVLTLVTDGTMGNPNNVPVTLRVPYSPGTWNQATAMYDNSTVQLFNQGATAADAFYQAKPLTGPIKIASEGIDISGCVDMTDMFVGAISRLQISKCLKPKWLSDFSALAATAQPQPIPL